MFADGELAKFGLPIMEEDSRRGETFFVSQVLCGMGWEKGFSEWFWSGRKWFRQRANFKDVFFR